MTTFVERHAKNIRGVLSCFDRVVITGTHPAICHAEAMGRYLRAENIRIFDYTKWAEALRLSGFPNGRPDRPDKTDDVISRILSRQVRVLGVKEDSRRTARIIEDGGRDFSPARDVHDQRPHAVGAVIDAH